MSHSKTTKPQILSCSQKLHALNWVKRFQLMQFSKNTFRAYMFLVDMIIRNLLSSLVPTEPLNLDAFNITSQQLNVSWSEPKRRNGILTNYTVYYKLLRNDKNQNGPATAWEKKTIFSNKLSVELKNLGKLFNLQFKLQQKPKLDKCVHRYALGISLQSKM